MWPMILPLSDLFELEWIRNANGYEQSSSKYCETTSNFSPSSSTGSIPNSNCSPMTIAQTPEERERRRCQRGSNSFLLVGQDTFEDDVDRSADIYVPTDGCHFLKSADRTRKSILPQFTPAHLSLSSHSRCLIRDALQAQFDSHTWTLITAWSASLHHPWIPLLP